MNIRASRQEADHLLDESRHKAEVCGHDPPTMLRAHLVGLYTSGLMTAKALTTLCWFITMAGGAGVKDLAQSPATVGFNASRTCIRALGLDLIQSTLMDVEIPIYSRTSCKTSLGHISVLPFFEAMSIEFKRKQHLFMKHVQDETLLCDNFHEHAIVKSRGATKCFPLRLFFDYARLDNKVSSLNVFVSCLHLSLRYPIISLHGRTLCKCGCRGTHTLQPLWDIIAWMFRVAESGIRPKTDHRGLPWPPSSLRAQLADEPLFDGFHGVLCEVSGDLDEYPKTVGLPDYRSNVGCLRCFKHKRDFGNIGERAADRRNKWLVTLASSCLCFHNLTTEAVEQLRSSIRGYRKKGGQILTKRVPLAPGLQPGDRIEPACGRIPDCFIQGRELADAPAHLRKAELARTDRIIY